MPRLSTLSCVLLAIASTCLAQADNNSTFTADAATTASTCSQLSAALPGKVFLPGSSPYDASVAEYFYLQNRLDPQCFVKPTASADVATAIKVLAKTKAKFAVKGGGHATNRFWSNIVTGVTIDLKTMNSISVDTTKLIANVGPGALSVDLYEVLDVHNLSFNGGRVADVGIAGFTTGGGVSFFAPQRGWACDSVANFEVVLSTGDIVNANAYSNPDLYVALKGGQNNFGVVTRFDINVFNQGLFWGGTIIYPDTTDDQQVAAFTKFKTPANFDPYTAVEQSHVYVSAQNLFIDSASIYYSKPVVNATSLKEFTDIQPQELNTMRISNASDFAREVQSLGTPNQFGIFSTTTFQISPTILAKVLAAFKASRSAVGAQVSSAGMVSSMTWQSIPPPPPNPFTPNSFGFPPNSTPQKDEVLCLISDFWTNTADEAPIRASLSALLNQIDGISKAEGKFVSYKYLNYAADFQDPIGSTGTKPLLQLVSKKYDKIQMFQNQVTGGFKLFP